MKIEDLKKGQYFYSKVALSYDYRYGKRNLYVINKTVQVGKGYQVHLIIEQIEEDTTMPLIISFTDFKRYLIPLKDNCRVHIDHCCARHGCKYGDKDCPVENGYVNQRYDCECCGSAKEDAINELEEIGFKRTGHDNKLFYWDKYDFFINEKDIYFTSDVLLEAIEYVKEESGCCPCRH